MLHGERGQGLLEYILLIVVIIGMALAIGLRLFKPFSEWAGHYIGGYIECLLDEGELPSLGGAETITGCEGNFEGFTLAGGRPPKNNQNSRNNQDEQASSDNRARQNNSGVTTPGGRRGGARVGAGFDGPKNTRSFEVAPAGGAGDASRRVSYDGGSAGGPTRRPIESQYSGVTGILEQEREKIKKREEKLQRIGRSDAGGAGGTRTKKTMPVEVKKSSQKPPDFEMDDWSFGASLRTLFIIVIIIALVLFLAGQVAQINKSLEKE